MSRKKAVDDDDAEHLAQVIVDSFRLSRFPAEQHEPSPIGPRCIDSSTNLRKDQLRPPTEYVRFLPCRLNEADKGGYPRGDTPRSLIA